MVRYRTVVLEVSRLIPTDRMIWFSKIVFFIQNEAKIKKIPSPTISVYSLIYNISGEIRRNRLNISEKLNR